MKVTYLYAIAFMVVLVVLLVPASAAFEARNLNAPFSTSGMTISKGNVLEKFSAIQETPVFTQQLNELSRYRSTTGTSQTSVSITDSISPYGYCSSCSGVNVYSVVTHYSTGPTYYPSPIETTERGYGSMVVSGPSSGGPYYLWVKPLFFATDVEDYYDMQWHYCGILPVNFDKNILSGSYCLKVTKGRTSSSDAVWCATAVVAPNQTTVVNLPAYLSGCPFGCSNCC
ncbi:MAG TPA: hypothetical protein PLE70_07300 [Methanolinea sp.]|nr:hypothetical protein [Methanolinea sp.]